MTSQLNEVEPKGRRELTRCMLCRGLSETVPAVAPTAHGFPADARNVVYNARTFVQDGLALIHHDCGSATATNDDTPYWTPGTNWWACSEPSRLADAGVCFDLNCDRCASRWIELRDVLSVFQH